MTDTHSEAEAPRRVRPTNRPKRRRSKVPVTIRYGLPLIALVMLVIRGYEWWESTRVELQFVDASGQAVQLVGTLEVFESSSHPADASPPRMIGEPIALEGDSVVLDRELVGPGVFVRWNAEGYGRGFDYVEKREEPSQLLVAPPISRGGTVLSARGEVLAGAQVFALGRDVNGLVLAESETDADGRFLLDGVSGEERIWVVRVIAEGHELRHVDWTFGPRDRPTETGPSEIRLAPADVRPGQVVVPSDLLASGFDPSVLRVGVLSLRALRLPVKNDGSFSLDHVPTKYQRVHLILEGLPDGWTHRRTTVEKFDAEARIEVVPARRLSGVVVNGHDRLGVSGARVRHSHGPRGDEIVETDDRGRFEFVFAPGDAIEVFAEKTIRAVGAEPRRNLFAKAEVAADADESLELVFW